MSKDEITDLLLEDKVEEAIQALRKLSPSDGIIINLASQWRRLQNEVLSGSMSQDRIDLRHNQIVGSLLELVKRLPASASASSGASADKVPASNGSPTVFLSYNHKDTDTATKIKDFLRSKNINVTIDSEAMNAGEDIAEFINKCIRQSDVTLSLVSTNSLLSAWVGIETMNTLVGEKIAGKKFISVVIDGAFYDRGFVDTAFTTIEERMAELKALILARLDKDRGIEDLQSERTRNKNLLNDLPEIVANLRARLNVDIVEPNFNAGMEKVVKAVLG